MAAAAPSAGRGRCREESESCSEANRSEWEFANKIVLQTTPPIRGKEIFSPDFPLAMLALMPYFSPRIKAQASPDEWVVSPLDSKQ